MVAWVVGVVCVGAVEPPQSSQSGPRCHEAVELCNEVCECVRSWEVCSHVYVVVLMLYCLLWGMIRDTYGDAMAVGDKFDVTASCGCGDGEFVYLVALGNQMLGDACSCCADLYASLCHFHDKPGFSQRCCNPMNPYFSNTVLQSSGVISCRP